MSGSRLTQVSEAFKARMPASLWRPLRAVATAILTPLRFSMATGHWTSSLRASAQTRAGAPLPWYTYPAIDFLSQRSFAGKDVLEFGGGQSTLWWAERAATVLTVEEDPAWYALLAPQLPGNVTLHHSAVDFETRSIAHVRALIGDNAIKLFDVIVIDGHLRRELVELAFNALKPDGALILDNSEGFGFVQALTGRRCMKIDFFGFAPGVSKRHCTSLVFVDQCFLLDPTVVIPVFDA